MTGVVVFAISLVQADVQKSVDFNRDIRSILSNKCFQCHGPDESKRQGNLRLDVRDGAVAELDSGSVAVVPGKPEQSELVRRIVSDDVDERMPPMDSGRTLSPEEIRLLTEWIQQGGNYAQHWSYVRPVRPSVPVLQESDASWPQNSIDRFILDRLQRSCVGEAALPPRPPSTRRRFRHGARHRALLADDRAQPWWSGACARRGAAAAPPA